MNVWNRSRLASYLLAPIFALYWLTHPTRRTWRIVVLLNTAAVLALIIAR